MDCIAFINAKKRWTFLYFVARGKISISQWLEASDLISSIPELCFVKLFFLYDNQFIVAKATMSLFRIPPASWKKFYDS